MDKEQIKKLIKQLIAENNHDFRQSLGNSLVSLLDSPSVAVQAAPVVSSDSGRVLEPPKETSCDADHRADKSALEHQSAINALKAKEWLEKILSEADEAFDGFEYIKGELDLVREFCEQNNIENINTDAGVVSTHDLLKFNTLLDAVYDTFEVGIYERVFLIEEIVIPDLWKQIKTEN